MRRIIPFVLMFALSGCAQADLDKNFAYIRGALAPQNAETKKDEQPDVKTAEAQGHNSPVLDALGKAFGVGQDNPAAPVIAEATVEPKDEAPLRLTRAQDVQSASKSIVFVSRSVTDIHTLSVYFKYTGAKPVRNLDLAATLGREQPHDRTKSIPPGTTLVARFRFDKADLSRVDVGAIPVKVAYAESL
jgi:hypothetical protein